MVFVDNTPKTFRCWEYDSETLINRGGTLPIGIDDQVRSQPKVRTMLTCGSHLRPSVFSIKGLNSMACKNKIFSPMFSKSYIDSSPLCFINSESPLLIRTNEILPLSERVTAKPSVMDVK